MKGSTVAAFAAAGLILFSGNFGLAKPANNEFGNGYCRVSQVNNAPVVSKVKRAQGGNTVKATVHIHATPDVVWRAIHEERQHDPELAYSKVLSQNGDELTLEQKFTILPVIGTAVCVMSNKEVPNQKIEYRLVKSDRFKAMEGAWEIDAVDSGRCTQLTLSSYVDLGLNVPRHFMDDITGKKINRRLGNVKKSAERTQSGQIAHKASL